MNGVGKDVSAAIVNFETPDLTRMAVWSLHSLYSELPIFVVDSGSRDDSVPRLHDLSDEVPPLELIECSANVHHGPGLDLVIRRVETEWVLVFDSDCIAYRTGFIERMLSRVERPEIYMVGQRLLVNEHGFPPSAEDAVHPYVHPKCALVRRSIYLENPPFEKHGVPCLKNELAAAARGFELIAFPVDDYVFHLGRGTAARSGYRLGVRGWLSKQNNRLRRLVRG